MTIHTHQLSHPWAKEPVLSSERLLDEREAAKFLGISPRTLWGLASRGEVPYIRIGRITKRYDPRDLREFCDLNRTGGSAAPQPAHNSLEDATTKIDGGKHDG